jgi:hypothetical protein
MRIAGVYRGVESKSCRCKCLPCHDAKNIDKTNFIEVRALECTMCFLITSLQL